jgi:hypothetical protein
MPRGLLGLVATAWLSIIWRGARAGERGSEGSAPQRAVCAFADNPERRRGEAHRATDLGDLEGVRRCRDQRVDACRDRSDDPGGLPCCTGTFRPAGQAGAGLRRGMEQASYRSIFDGQLSCLGQPHRAHPRIGATPFRRPVWARSDLLRHRGAGGGAAQFRGGARHRSAPRRDPAAGQGASPRAGRSAGLRRVSPVPGSPAARASSSERA